MFRSMIFIALILFVSAVANGQGFSSGSTGADGALDLSALSCTTCEVQLPESGILNYTTVNIPAGKSLKFKPNSRNTPVIMLAQGNVQIDGTIDVSAPPSPSTAVPPGSRVPGPGGFYGGAVNQPGFGPGGGAAGGFGGSWVGPLSLVPIIGGSGAGGYATSSFGIVGGGGGGAITIASSTQIILTSAASIKANGGCSFSNGGSCGSGGAIRLVANSINVAGILHALAGSGSAHGVIRLEAPQGVLIFTGTSTPAAALSTINPVVVPSNTPSLQIVSVGGYPVPSYSGTRFDTVDLLLPNQITDPINVVVQGSNIPVGTQVKITSSAISTTGTLQGTLQSSTATLTISNLDRTVGAVNYLFVYATFNPPAISQNYNPKGRDQVTKVRLESAPGARSKFVFLRKDGTEIDPKRLPPAFLQEFGMQ